MSDGRDGTNPGDVSTGSTGSTGSTTSTGRNDVTLASLRSVSRGASMHLVGKVVLDCLEFLLNVVLTRALGSRLYGVYAYGHTFVQIATVFTNLGTNNSLLKYVPQYEDDPRKQRLMVGLAYVTSFVASFVVAAVMYLSAPVVNQYTLGEPLFADVLRLFAAMLVFDTMRRVLNSTFRSLERLEYQVLVDQLARPAARLGAVGLALAVGLEFYGVMASLVAASLLALGLAAAIFLSRVELRPTLDPRTASREEVVEYYNFSVPLMLKDAGSILRSRVDVLMVGYFLSSTAVGIYNVCLLVSGMIGLALSAFNQLFPPVASRLYANGDVRELNELFGIVTRWTVTIMLFLGAGAVVYRAELLALFGEEFATGAAALVLVVFVVGRVFSNGTGPSGYLLMVTGHQYVLLANQWVFGVANVVANYYFILEFGLVGAALATTIVNALNNVARLLEIWYLEGLFPYSSAYLKPVVAVGGAGAVMYGVGLYVSGPALLVAGGAAGLAVYLAGLYLLGIEAEDRAFLRDVLPT